MDDWVLATFNIPSITSEIGTEDEFIGGWQSKSTEVSYQLVKDNQPWLEYVFQKAGPKVAVDSGTYK